MHRSRAGSDALRIGVDPRGYPAAAPNHPNVESYPEQCVVLAPSEALGCEGNIALSIVSNTEGSAAVWGILNLTPDSFSDGGRFVEQGAEQTRSRCQSAVAAARQMASDGAQVIDVGGESTRPGSEQVSADEEARRVLPFLEALAEHDFPLPISIDTRRAAMAVAAHQRGVTIVNDTSALRDDPELGSVVAELGMHVVLMHRQGTPRDMQDSPHYDDVVDEVRAFLERRVEFAVASGIPEQRIMIDPGLGFGKRPEHNDRLVRELGRLRIGSRPFLVGASRKSFLGRFDARPHAQRLGGSLAFVAAAVARGAEAVRVHDVADTVAFLRTNHNLESGGHR